MAYDDVITRNESEELAVRVVNSTEGSNSSTYDDVFTRDTDGKLAVRVVGAGGGGSDVHNLGWYATQSALEEAHPTAESGDYAIVGSTDSVWVWDEDTTAWVNTAVAGTVTSVNNQTGVVVLTASDVGALPSNTHIPADQVNADWNSTSGVSEILNKPTLGTAASASTTDFATAAQGAKADTAVQPADLATVATTGQYSDLSGKPTIPEATQVSTMPTASADELGKIYQFTGTTDANYTNGYFYKCVSDGQDPATYSWSNIQVQASSGGLPSQTGQSGKFLTTDGTDASWATINALQNTATGYDALTILGTPSASDTALNIGKYSVASGRISLALGCYSSATAVKSISILGDLASGARSMAIGSGAKATAVGAIMINTNDNVQTNSDSNTFKIANANGNFEIMSADGTVPTARLTKVNSTITLTAAGWSSSTQTVTVNGITSSSVVFVSPDPTDVADYVAGGILCTAQGTNSLTFTCSTTPANDIDVVIVAM